MTHEEIVAAIVGGKRVLVRAKDYAHRRDWMFAIYHVAQEAGIKSIELRRWHHKLVDADSGGYAQFALTDDEVRGQEYHAGVGQLTVTMKIRVRL